MKAIVCGGGTGGHIYPALAIAAQLRCDQVEVMYMGAHDSAEARLAGAAGFPFRGVEACGLHRKSPRVVWELARNYRGMLQARQAIRAFAPDFVIGTGGYAEAPVVKAAQGLRIPTLLHEQNAFPGLANRRLSRRADAVCLTFEAAARYFPHAERLHTTGLPVRRSVLDADREAAFAYFAIPPQEQARFTLLITGGSQGAARLNEAALAAYPRLLGAGIRILHICGREHAFAVKQRAPRHPLLHLLPYLDEMQHALALADLAVARSGASFLAEAACVGLPTILVPYPYAANDHQQYNADAFAARDAALVVRDAALTGPALADAVCRLAENRLRLETMREAALSLAHRDAAQQIVNIAYGLCKQD